MIKKNSFNDAGDGTCMDCGLWTEQDRMLLQYS